MSREWSRRSIEEIAKKIAKGAGGKIKGRQMQIVHNGSDTLGVGDAPYFITSGGSIILVCPILKAANQSFLYIDDDACDIGYMPFAQGFKSLPRDNESVGFYYNSISDVQFRPFITSGSGFNRNDSAGAVKCYAADVAEDGTLSNEVLVFNYDDYNDTSLYIGIASDIFYKQYTTGRDMWVYVPRLFMEGTRLSNVLSACATAVPSGSAATKQIIFKVE